MCFYLTRTGHYFVTFLLFLLSCQNKKGGSTFDVIGKEKRLDGTCRDAQNFFFFCSVIYKEGVGLLLLIISGSIVNN